MLRPYLIELLYNGPKNLDSSNHDHAFLVSIVLIYLIINEQGYLFFFLRNGKYLNLVMEVFIYLELIWMWDPKIVLDPQFEFWEWSTDLSQVLRLCVSSGSETAMNLSSAKSWNINTSGTSCGEIINMAYFSLICFPVSCPRHIGVKHLNLCQ